MRISTPLFILPLWIMIHWLENYLLYRRQINWWISSADFGNFHYGMKNEIYYGNFISFVSRVISALDGLRKIVMDKNFKYRPIFNFQISPFNSKFIYCISVLNIIKEDLIFLIVSATTGNFCFQTLSLFGLAESERQVYPFIILLH